MRVLAVAEDYSSGHYRVRQPISALRGEQRVQASVSEEGLPAVFNRQTGRFVSCDVAADVLLLLRPCFWFMPDLIRHVQSRGVRVVVDVDDDFHAVHPLSRDLPRSHPQTSPLSNFQHLRRCCAAADLVTVSTPALAHRYGAHGRVAVLRNCVDDEWLEIPRKPNRRTIIGWSGSPSHHPTDLQVTHGGVGSIVDELGAQFLAIGGETYAKKVQEALGLEKKPQTTPWLPLELYPYMLARLDVGIVPLAHTKFNEAKCLDAATPVMTDTGIRPIGEISEADRVWSQGRWRPVEAVEQNPRTTGFRIETALGLRLDLTPNHRLRSASRWLRADELRVGDPLDLEGEQWPQALPYPLMPWPAESRRSRAGFSPDAFLCAESGPRVAIDERWGRLLGLFVGDGGARHKTALHFSVDGQDADLIQLITDDLRAVGLNATTETETTWGGDVLRRRSVRVSSAALTRALAGIGLLTAASGPRKRIVRVPALMWTAPRSVVAQFLAGLFEADGTVGRSGVALCTKEERLARDVQRLLVGFGIFARVVARPGRGEYADRRYWLVTLRRASADVFAREIGFLSARKQRRLDELVERPHSNAYRPIPESDQIVAITPRAVDPVDLQVEGAAFTAAGIVSHNSWLKGIEYSALGIPFVASPTPEYEQLAGIGLGILAADRRRAWRRAARFLLTDPELEATGSRAREIVREHLTISGNAWRWAEAWESTMVRGFGTRRIPGSRDASGSIQRHAGRGQAVGRACG